MTCSLRHIELINLNSKKPEFGAEPILVGGTNIDMSKTAYKMYVKHPHRALEISYHISKAPRGPPPYILCVNLLISILVPPTNIGSAENMPKIARIRTRLIKKSYDLMMTS